MPVYNIRFENQFGSSQKYAFFSGVPRIAATVETAKLHSNVFMSQTVANNDTWRFTFSTVFYAWCGVAPAKLASGVKVNGGGKSVTLGAPGAPGTTWLMYNNYSSPAFHQPSATAGHGAFEIDTTNDFHPRMDFVIGVGGIDSSNRVKPLATLEAPRNARINLAPVAKFYIAATEMGVGTAVDPAVLSRAAACIDFGAHPGMSGVIVKRLSSGAYSVQYTTQSV